MSMKNIEDDDKKENISFNDFGDVSDKNDLLNEQEGEEEQNQSQLEVVQQKQGLQYIQGNQDEENFINQDDLQSPNIEEDEEEKASTSQKNNIPIKQLQEYPQNQPQNLLPQQQQQMQQQQQQLPQHKQQQQQIISQPQTNQQTPQQLTASQQQQLQDNYEEYFEDDYQNINNQSPDQRNDQNDQENLEQQYLQQQQFSMQQQQQHQQPRNLENQFQINYNQISASKEDQYNINNQESILTMKCTYHQDDTYCYYCKTCKDFRICVQCLSSGAHENHEIINNKKASAYFQQNIKDITVILKERCEFLSLRESVIVNHGKEIQDYFKEMQNFIRKKFTEISEYLEKKEEEFKENLDDVQNKTLTQFDKDLSTLHQEYENSLEKLNFYKSVVDQDNSSLITQIYGERVEEIEQLLHSSIQSYFSSPQVTSFTSISLKKEDLQQELKHMIENIKKFQKKIVFEESPEKQQIFQTQISSTPQAMLQQQQQLYQNKQIQKQQQISDINSLSSQQRSLNNSQNIKKSQVLERQQVIGNQLMNSNNVSAAYRQIQQQKSSQTQFGNNQYNQSNWSQNSVEKNQNFNYNNSRINQVKQEIDLCLGQKFNNQNSVSRTIAQPTVMSNYSKYQNGLNYIGKQFIEAKIRSLSPSSNNSSMNQSKNNSYNANYTANKTPYYTQNSNEKSVGRRMNSNYQQESSLNKSLSILKMQNVLFQRGMRNFFDNN